MWEYGCEGEFAGEERGSACLKANTSGIDRWLRSRSRSGRGKVGIDRGDSQGEGILEAETCWLSLSCMPARSGENTV